jgi:hypothetical protein
MNDADFIRAIASISVVVIVLYLNVRILIRARWLGLRVLLLNLLGLVLVACGIVVAGQRSKFDSAKFLIDSGVLVFTVSTALTLYAYFRHSPQA